MNLLTFRASFEDRGASIQPIPFKRGRHSNENQNKAFLQVAEYLEKNDDEQNTITDLYKMTEKLTIGKSKTNSSQSKADDMYKPNSCF